MAITTPLVNIVIPAYNHEPYIVQAIESVFLQQCDFEYQIVIGEDCSTDNTRKICEEYQAKYPNKILLLKGDQNIGLIRNYKRIFDACTAKYLTILESDDYWTDPLKLTMQVSVMEADETIGLVHTRSATQYQNGELKINTGLRQSQLNYHELYREILMGKYRIVPLTACFRRALLQQIDFEFCVNNELKTIDAFLWPTFALQSKFFFIDRITGHYRNLNTSVSNSTEFEQIEAFSLSGKKILSYYFERYPVADLQKEDLFQNNAYFLAYKSLVYKRYDKALQYSSELKLDSIRNVWIWFLSRWAILHPLFTLQLSTNVLLSRVKQKFLKLFRKA